jgi:histone deacetylase complex regulatory component SIN3
MSVIALGYGESVQHMRKNQYEEHLVSCEDGRFELDMCIECNCSGCHCYFQCSCYPRRG